MEVSGAISQQALLQQNLSTQAVKNTAKAEKSSADLISQAAENAKAEQPSPSGGRGGIVDISV